MKLVLVGNDAGWARTLVHDGVAERLLDADTSGLPESSAHAILEALGDEAGRLDGVFTLWEDAVPATARVAEALGLPGMPPAAADGARSKLRTLEASRDAGLPTPRFMHIPDASTLAAAAEHVRFPAVIKPVFGAEALGCLRVDDLPSLEEGYARVSALITPELNAIFQQGEDLLLEEYLDGPEFDVDLVLSDGECVFSAISENWPTEEPYFVETGMHSPSSHPVDRQDAMADLCIRTAYALGFRDGVLHAEAKDTSNGPRLLEMNARLAGGIIEEIHRIVTGVSLLVQQVLLAVGLPAVPAPYPASRWRHAHQPARLAVGPAREHPFPRPPLDRPFGDPARRDGRGRRACDCCRRRLPDSDRRARCRQAERRGRGGGGARHGRRAGHTVPALILENCLVRTMDPQVPTQRALAIAGDRIAGGVGVHETALASPDVVDLGGRVVLPGFTDAHVHFPTWALSRSDVALEGCASLDEALERIRVGGRPAGGVVRGYGWRSGDWPAAVEPTAARLDEVTGATPAAMIAKDYHSLWLNSAALALANGDLEVEGGVVERDASGAPTGVLREEAAWRFKERYLSVPDDAYVEAMRPG